MKISDAQKILNDNKGKHLYDVIIPSTGIKIPFAPMSVGHHKSMAKMAIDDESNFDKFLCALILELSNEKVNLSTITEYDKMSILYQIKQNNSSNPLKVTLECPKCESKNTVQPTDKDMIKEEVKISYIKKYKDYELEIGMPSVEMGLFYSSFCDTRFDMLDDKQDDKHKQDEIDKLTIFIGSYEVFLMCVKSIKINDDYVEDFLDVGIEERIGLIEKLPNGLIDINEIREFINNKHKEYAYNIVCNKCEHKFEDLFAPENFFF